MLIYKFYNKTYKFYNKTYGFYNNKLMGFGMGFGIWDGIQDLGWDFGIWDGIWDFGMGGILPFPSIWAASIVAIDSQIT